MDSNIDRLNAPNAIMPKPVRYRTRSSPKRSGGSRENSGARNNLTSVLTPPDFQRAGFLSKTRAHRAPGNADFCRAVIASEAKQSILSWCGEVDCFASLAMTTAVVAV